MENERNQALTVLKWRVNLSINNLFLVVFYGNNISYNGEKNKNENDERKGLVFRHDHQQIQDLLLQTERMNVFMASYLQNEYETKRKVLSLEKREGRNFAKYSGRPLDRDKSKRSLKVDCLSAFRISKEIGIFSVLFLSKLGNL